MVHPKQKLIDEAEARLRAGQTAEPERHDTEPPPSGKEWEDELDSLTRDELYATAQELEISGRSSMNREELIDAIREAQEQEE